jgi:hypothetical protein
MARKVVDWEAVELAFRAGLLSVREIAAAHGVSHTAIQKRAKEYSWDRDLEAKIQARADALVAKRQVASEVATPEKLATERVIVEANAQAIANIRSAHRLDIERARRLCMALVAELESATGNLPELVALGEMLRAPNENGTDRLNDIYQAVISLPERTKTMKALSESLKNLVGLEREAYGLATAEATPTRPQLLVPIPDGKGSEVYAAMVKTS